MHGKSTGQLHGRVRAVNGSVDGRCAAAYGPCTRPCNVSCARYTAAVYTAREHVFACKNGPYKPYNGRAVYTARTQQCMGRAHGPSTPPVYMTVCAQTSSDVYMARTRPRTRDVYTAVYGSCTQPCTRQYTAAYTCLRVYVSKGRLHGRVRAIYTAEKVRLYTALLGRVMCRVHGSVRAVCTAVFGRVHWPCTLPFSAVYIARARPCNGPCTRPLHGRVQGSSGPCIRQVGLLCRVHVPRRHATAVCGPLRRTVRVCRRVHGPSRRTCRRLCMGRVHDRIHGALRRVHGPRP